MGDQAAIQPLTPADTFSIAGWQVYASANRIGQGERTIKLEPRTMGVLLCLARRPGEVVTREQLEAEVWRGMVVGYDALSNAIAKLRRAFDDDRQHPRVIETIPKVGYRLIGEVSHLSTESGPSTHRLAAKTAWPATEIDLSLPDKPSIAVLPFTNLSGDPEHEYFTDGVTEDIITELSRFHSLFVIARNSTFTYKGKAVDVRTVARELGVRYVLEGSIRRTGKRVRVTPQLIDSLTGRHVWAERYDRVLEDVFLVQQEITQSVVAAIAPQIQIAERNRTLRRRPEDLSAYELAVRAFAMARDAFSKTDGALCEKAIEQARAALAIDENSVLALQTIAWADIQRVAFASAPDVMAAWREGLEAATKAIDLDRSDGASYASKGLLLAYSPDLGPLSEALDYARRAVELNPNSAMALAVLAVTEIYAGNSVAAIDLLSQALRLSPCDPDRFFWDTFLSIASCMIGDHANGVKHALHAVREAPGLAPAHAFLAANLVGIGELERARSALATARGLGPKVVERLSSGGLFSRSAAERMKIATLLRTAAGLEDPDSERAPDRGRKA